ncbi:putative bifunctional diguanylate cyclase/phosphodiesterase [Quatrionicoccus australiensis]|uniref:putative bifunctional diguanylate cyclase/phosphodiesterase n=1 Tax=Quatrionicoccus australiensis TaxID=138118 RepID=UPI001CF937E0|nr:bifunctional diguanylate cyclase/phosphodiesterase [Quatrionicoccus australiensis]MCB4361432.1 EAL domain-containing protein [Quatrionicoccus australiensis]
MNTCLETEILYQISLVIGSSTELGPMLRRTASTLLRLLNGTSCAILRATPAAHDGQPAEAACLLPRHPLANPSFHAFLLYGAGLSEQQSAPRVREIGDTHFHFYHLPGFGTLVFGRQGEALSQTLQLAFLPLAEKLAQAAVVCLIKDSMQLAASVFESSQEGIMISDADNRIVDVNRAFSRITGFARDEVVGRDPRLLSSGMQEAAFYQTLWQDLQKHDSWRGEIWNRRKSGEIYAEMLSIAVIRDPQGAVKNHLAVFTDINHLKEHEAELYRISHFDPLTALPNRRLLDDRLRQAMAHAHRTDGSLGICLLDLDGFKAVNDAHGHKTGDILLSTIATRLQASVREDDTIARLGGDEFVIVLQGISDPGECDEIMRRILYAAATPVSHGDITCQVSASIGVTFFPSDDADADTLIRHADQAMYLAKQSGKNRYQLFDTQQDRQVQAHRESRLRLAWALQNDELCLFYQPKVDLRSGEIVGLEALIRWQHPELGLLAPANFLPALAGTELEIGIGQWVIHQALRQLAQWQAAGREFGISINISAHHLQQPDFTRQLQDAIARVDGIDPRGLELEILETAAITRLEDVSKTLLECRALGISIALDDFGTGYSSLTYFQRLPIQTLKIDQGFVRNMLTAPGDRSIVESVIRLAQAFERDVIAEGVESMQHAASLYQLGCHIVQGYGIARPMPADNLPAWMDKWEQEASWLSLPAPGRTTTMEG